MSFLGIVRNGHVELPPEAHLPDGTSVRVFVPELEDPADHLEEEAVDGGSPDMAINHDWYASGAPREVE